MGINEYYIGKMVIVRTESAGVFFGEIIAKEGCEVIVKDARRMHSWKAAKSIALSGCALYGIDHSQSAICAPVSAIWLEAIELIECTPHAITSLLTAPEVQAR